MIVLQVSDLGVTIPYGDYNSTIPQIRPLVKTEFNLFARDALQCIKRIVCIPNAPHIAHLARYA